jgi:hypothetical protein
MIWPTKIRYKNPTIIELRPEEELNIYEIQDFLRLRVLEGQAEVFGRELPVGETVFFYKGQNLAIFTWKGAKIEIEDHQGVIVNKAGNGDSKSQPMR